MKNRKQKIHLAHFLFAVVLLLGSAALWVYVMDPFFHYHKPWFGLKVTESTKEYQIPGMLANLEYDSVLAGSSVVMSINTDSLDERFGCRTVKAVGGSAEAALLHEYLERAFLNRDLKYVFYGLDVFSFYGDPDQQVISEDVAYLVNENPFDDIYYLWNMDIIGEKIPDMLAQSFDDAYDPGMIYQVNADAELGPDEVLKMHCPGAGVMQKVQPADYRKEEVAENINRLGQLVDAHPDTGFLFFLPPYSIVWWDNAYEKGLLDTYLYTLNLCMEQLLSYPNVSIYTTDFNEKSTIGNLYQYMDYIHAGTAVTERMPLQIGNPEYEITVENYKQQTEQLKDVFFSFRRKVESEGYGFVYETEQNW